MTDLGLLLPYQRRLLAATAHDPVVVCEKSRRIGMTWAVAADAVLTAGAARAAGGQDVYYIGYNRDMTREFVDTCAMWAREFLRVAVEAEEFLFRDQGEGEDSRDIQAFRIRFASTFEIVALCSRPRSLRGRQGYVIVDEAAFHDDLAELLKAALALTIWGGRVLIISTHDGAENPFNLLVNDCRAGKLPYGLVRVTFAEAISEGLYRRVCAKLGRAWSAAGEVEWSDEIRRMYGDAAGEELDCIPRHSSGRYLNAVLIEARLADVPVVRWSLPDTFVDAPEDVRVRMVREWCEATLAPLLAQIKGSRSFLGQDFGRSGDLSVSWPVVEGQDLRRRTPFVLELRNVPFRAQEQIVFFIIDRLPGFAGGAFDARGNGQYLAEVARQRYGAERIAEVMLSEGWYREHMPPMKAALEDGTQDVPRDKDVVDDLRSLEVVKGVARAPERATQGSTGQRHADAAIALVLVTFAARTLEGGPVDVAANGDAYESLDAYAGDVGSMNTAGELDM